jgi:hypothetical protein
MKILCVVNEQLQLIRASSAGLFVIALTLEKHADYSKDHANDWWFVRIVCL